MSDMPPWSFSSLTKFETCPRQYHVVKVLKLVKEPPTVHTEWGNEVHKALELRVVEKKPLPEKLVKYESLVAKLDGLGGDVFAERKYALTKALKPTEWDASDCWARGILDIGVVADKKALIADWKTGKVKPTDQLKLSAGMVMSTHEQVQKVGTIFVWLAHDRVTRDQHTRDDLPLIWTDFVHRANRLEMAFDMDKWPPKPSGLCNGWCPVGREHCEFWCPKKLK